jgi:hypothetical protein
LTTLNVTLGLARPSLDALRPVAPLITPALSELIQLSGPAIALLHEAPSLFDAANAALPSITRFAQAFKPAVDALLPAAREVAPIISVIGVYHRELVAGMANLAADLQATAVASTSTGSASYLRAVSMIGRESIFGQTIREPTSRNNTYFAPGELANVGKGGLLSANCNNLNNVSQVPAMFGNVRCKLQPPFNWPSPLLSAYYPHTTRAPLPK